jgi:hypothetical protein
MSSEQVPSSDSVEQTKSESPAERMRAERIGLKSDSKMPLSEWLQMRNGGSPMTRIHAQKGTGAVGEAEMGAGKREKE